MALVTAGVKDDRVPSQPSLGLLAVEGRRWASSMGLPLELLDEGQLVELGYSVVMMGDHQPDLLIATCETLGVPYRVKEKATTRGGMTYVRRHVVVDPPEEPEPTPEPERSKREMGKERRVKLDGVRVSQAEKDELDEAANAAGMSRSEWIRKTLFNAVQGDRAWRGETVDPGWLEETQRVVESLKHRGPNAIKRPDRS